MKLRPQPLDLPKDQSTEDEVASQEITHEGSSEQGTTDEVASPSLTTSPNGLNNVYETVCIAGRTFKVVSLITHLNICLYATCFWIQIGALPVSGLFPPNLLIGLFLL